jgi:hypothetical protein
MLEQRAGSGNAVEAHRANEFLCGLYYLMDRPQEALPHVREMADLPVCPPMARYLDCTAFWAFRLGDTATLSKVHDLMTQIVARWPDNLYTQAVKQHAGALQSWRNGSLADAGPLLQSSGMAYSIWTLFDLAEFLSRADPKLAEQYWSKIDEHRGDILELWFPGMLIMLWLGRALAAQARRDRAAAYRYSKKILDHWSESNPGLRVVQAARAIHAANYST